MSDFKILAAEFYAASDAAKPTTYGGVSLKVMESKEASNMMFRIDEKALVREIADDSMARTLRKIGDIYAAMAERIAP